MSRLNFLSTRPSSLILPVLVFAAAVVAEPGASTPNALRIARSSDGLRFSSDAEVFVEGGASPGLARLENDELVAVYDALGKSQDGVTEMTFRRSKDGGRTWSEPRRLEWDEKSLSRRVARHPELVVERDESLRLYFAALSGRKNSTAPPVIRSATARGEMRFKLDREVAIRCRGMVDPVPCVVKDESRRVMFLSDQSPAIKPEEPSTRYLLRRAVSRKSVRFITTASVELDDNIRITSVVALDKGFRAYGWSDDGIVSLRSDDLKGWDIEEGLRLKEGWDPAVARWKDGTYVMIYNAGPRPTPTDVTFADLALPKEGSETGLEEGDVDASWGGAEDLPSDMAPRPDFAEPVDYTKWYAENALEPTDDNAFDAYMSFMPRFDEEGVADREDWPEFNDMYNSGNHHGPPEPWKPEEHPDWDQSGKAAKEALTKFAEANLRSGYAMRVDPTPDSSPNGPPESRLLLNLMLPHLSPHRTLARATLADAWRSEADGKPSPRRMIDAWKTVLRGAEHLSGGSTLIEELVGIAEQNQVESSARWALRHGVFDEKQLSEAFDALRQYDRNAADVVKGVRGERAMAMDTTQYIFSPPDAKGQPVINMERFDRLMGIMGDGSEVTRDEVENMGPDDARATIEAFNDYYRELAEQMRIGYPDVRAADLHALEQQYVGTSPITRLLMPSLSLAHALRARAEASRRATQLAYAVHIQHARTGQWPKSLDELPKEFGDEIRIDPFTGRAFGYRVGRDGPTIYSASENGADDGGVHSPRWNDEIDNAAGSDDYVFWPPQR